LGENGSSLDLTTMHEDGVKMKEAEDETMEVSVQRVEPCLKGLDVTHEVWGKDIGNVELDGMNGF
jgi:hypothetical protein